MITTHVNVLGEDYKIIKCTTEESNGILNNDRDGICDVMLREIYVLDYEAEPIPVERDERINTNHRRTTKAILRHELVHAVLHESGLDSESDFAHNETLVDWVALQLPKLMKVMIQADALTKEELLLFRQLIDTQLKQSEGECDYV